MTCSCGACKYLLLSHIIPDLSCNLLNMWEELIWLLSPHRGIVLCKTGHFLKYTRSSSKVCSFTYMSNNNQSQNWQLCRTLSPLVPSVLENEAPWGREKTLSFGAAQPGGKSWLQPPLQFFFKIKTVICKLSTRGSWNLGYILGGQQLKLHFFKFRISFWW